MKNYLRYALALLALLLMVGQPAAEDAPPGLGQTPPRLSLIDGPVSFWRTGADDWSEAALNTPLAPGDALYVDDNANLELQVGNRAFVRAGERTQLSLVNVAPDYLQFRVADGQASFDLRALPAGLTIEVNTPNAAFTITRSGYYRLNVDQDTTSFITRRGGRATVVPSGRSALAIAPSEELIVEGIDTPSVESYAVPERDNWDRWNDDRTDHLIDSLSARYVPADVYGAEALDNHGDWRVEPQYGALWVPSRVPANWAPYSDGRWIWDTHYGWTWIDNAPWGWAPFHYGRWVHLNGYWAWAPGPVAARSVYAPALVAFYNAPSTVAPSFGLGTPGMSWVALSWGEPLTPWWGRPGFIGRPWWGGWHGPRVVRNVTHVTNITVYRNSRVNHAVIAARRDQFGRGPIKLHTVDAGAFRQLEAVRGHHPVRPGAFSVSTGAPTTIRPTREVLARPSVTVRAPSENRVPWKAVKPKGRDESRGGSAPELRFVPPPQRVQLHQAPFGRQSGPERAAPGQAPRFDETRRLSGPNVKGEERRNDWRDERRGERAPDRRDERPDERTGERRGDSVAERRDERIIERRDERSGEKRDDRSGDRRDDRRDERAGERRGVSPAVPPGASAGASPGTSPGAAPNNPPGTLPANTLPSPGATTGVPQRGPDGRRPWQDNRPGGTPPPVILPTPPNTPPTLDSGDRRGGPRTPPNLEDRRAPNSGRPAPAAPFGQPNAQPNAPAIAAPNAPPPAMRPATPAGGFSAPQAASPASAVSAPPVPPSPPRPPIPPAPSSTRRIDPPVATVAPAPPPAGPASRIDAPGASPDHAGRRGEAQAAAKAEEAARQRRRAEAEAEHQRGRAAEASGRESRRGDAQALPGQPANRLSPKRRGPGDPEDGNPQGGGRRN